MKTLHFNLTTDSGVTIKGTVLIKSLLVDTIVVPGVGQTGSVIKRIAIKAPEHIAVIPVAPYGKVPADEQSITTLAADWPIAAAHALKEAGHPGPFHIIGESQSAPGVLLAVQKCPELFSNIALIRPLGFTPVYALKDKKSLWPFLKRVLHSVSQFDQAIWKDLGNLHSGFHITRSLVAHGLKHTAVQFRIALTTDMAKLKHLFMNHKASHKKIAIFTAVNDKIFPAEEIKHNLHKAELNDVIELFVLEGSHSSMGTKAGASHLRAAMEYVRSSSLN